MRLYLLRDLHPDFDEAEGYVIRAYDAATARKMAANCGGDRPWKWVDPTITSCTSIGVVGRAGVLLRAFNAG